MKIQTMLHCPAVLSAQQMGMCYSSGQRHFWLAQLVNGKTTRFIDIGIHPANHALHLPITLDLGDYQIGTGTGHFKFRRKFSVTQQSDVGVFL